MEKASDFLIYRDNPNNKLLARVLIDIVPPIWTWIRVTGRYRILEQRLPGREPIFHGIAECVGERLVRWSEISGTELALMTGYNPQHSKTYFMDRFPDLFQKADPVFKVIQLVKVDEWFIANEAQAPWKWRFEKIESYQSERRGA